MARPGSDASLLLLIDWSGRQFGTMSLLKAHCIVQLIVDEAVARELVYVLIGY